MVQPKFEGVSVKLGGVDYIIPPMTLGQIKRLMPVIESLDKMKDQTFSTEQIDKLVELIHAPFSRNYPEISKDQLADMIDLKAIPGLISSVLDVNGLAPSAREPAA